MIFLSLILMEIILYMVIHHFFINYFIQLALIHYPPHACTCHEWRGKRSKGDLCSDRADLLLQMAKSCLILPPAIKISKSFAIFLMSLIFHSLISFIFFLRGLPLLSNPIRLDYMLLFLKWTCSSLPLTLYLK